MIYYISRHWHQYTVAKFKEECPEPLARCFTPLSYEMLFRSQSVRAGTLIFTDLDRLSQTELEIASFLVHDWRQKHSDTRILNVPYLFKQRFELLTTLWERGLNKFRVFRLDGAIPEDVRFPVFIRREAGAAGPETPLLQNRQSLDEAIARLQADGTPLRGRIVVEFCAQHDAGGAFRKYAAFRMGRHILPVHLMISNDWVVKANSKILDREQEAEELDYVTRNPHEEQLTQIFDIAACEYGRIDYSIVDGAVVTYEINSNPVMPPFHDTEHGAARQRLVQERVTQALTELCSSEDNPDEYKVELPKWQLDHLLPHYRAG